MSQKSVLPRNTPESQGIASAAIDTFLDGVDAAGLEMHSFMLLRHGSVVAEGWWHPYAPERRHFLYSLSKSFTSTAAGLAVEEGLLDIDSPVISFFPEETPAVISENLAKMRVRHLLSMSTGHAEEPRDQDSNWARTFLSKPVEFEPGTHFLYNSGATYMVSAILNKITGMSLTEYLTPRLLGPLGIEDPHWDKCPRGIEVGGWGMHIRTESIAKFGQFYLQRGKWEGVQLVPERWIDQATSKQVDNGDNPESDWSQGYGFQFWVCRHGAYRGDGAFAQFCVVIPDLDIVFASTAGTSDYQGTLNFLWGILPSITDKPFPENVSANQSLQTRLAGLRLRGVDGTPSSDIAPQVSGRTYRFDDNEDGWKSMAASFSGSAAQLSIETKNESYSLSIPGPDWTESTTNLTIGTFPSAMQARTDAYPCALSGAWTGPATYIAKICGIESPYTITLTLTFDGPDKITLDRRTNVAFSPTERPSLSGTV